MISLVIAGATRALGKAQGYYTLAVRDEPVRCAISGPDTPSMVTAWEPTPDELDRLNRGAPVLLRVMGRAHPPVMVTVGEVPVEEPR